MKGRSELFSKFMSFMNEIKTQHSAHVKVFQSDNTLEYTSFVIKNYFDSQGIIHELSCAYTPQQNGVSERKHKYLLEVTRSLMVHMSVPKHHWPEALLIIRMPSAPLNNDTSFHILFPNRPLHSLPPRTFGCVFFAHILPTSPDKLSAKSIKRVFLGYSRSKKGYICHSPRLRKTFITIEVTYFEEVPFYSSTSASISPSPSALPHTVDDLLHPSNQGFQDPPLGDTIRGFQVIPTTTQTVQHRTNKCPIFIT